MSTPTSQGEGARTPGDNQESVRSGVRPRLQRQMAQSRKTFRFRKSKHGQTETQERQPQVAHIDVEPTRLPPVTGSQIVTEDPALRELSVPLIPDDKLKSQTHASTKREKPKPSTIQPEQESMSEISNMETSTISGYRESFGGFDMSLQELERLEMQVRTGRYKEPLTGPPAPLSRKGSIAETRFHETKKGEAMVLATSEVSSTVVSHPAATMVPRPISDRATHHIQQEHPRTGISAHLPRHSEVHPSSTHPESHSLVTRTSVSVGAADIPYTLHRTHASNSTRSSHMPPPPHSAPQYTSHPTHAHHSVHFSDLTQQAHDRAQAPPTSQPSTSSLAFHPRSGSTAPQSHTHRPPPAPAPSTYHTSRQPQPICSTLSSQSKQHAAIYHGQTTYSSHKVTEASSHHAKPQHSTYSVYTPQTKDLDYTMHIPYTAYYTHETSPSHSGYPPDPTAKTSHVGYHSQTAVTSSKPTIHSPPQAVRSTHDPYHSSQGPPATPLSHKVGPQSVHTTTTLPPAKPTRSSHLSSQPTVWRHSWTEGEAKEQRVWGGRQEIVGAIETPSAYFSEQGKSKQGREGQHEGRSGEGSTTGELTSLLRRFDRRTPSEQSLLMTERDEDTLI